MLQDGTTENCLGRCSWIHHSSQHLYGTSSCYTNTSTLNFGPSIPLQLLRANIKKEKFFLALTPWSILVCSFSSLKAKAFSKTQLPETIALQSKVRGLTFKACLLHWKHWEACSVPARRENKVGWRTTHARFVFSYKGSHRAEAIYSQPHKSINVDKDIIWDHRTLFFHLRSDPFSASEQNSPFSYHEDTNLCDSSCIKLRCPHQSCYRNYSTQKKEKEQSATMQNLGSQACTRSLSLAEFHMLMKKRHMCYLP